jgi:hypothetical protein
VLKGVGHNAYKPTLTALLLHDLPDAVIGRGDMILNVLFPELALVLQILVGHAVFLTAHGHKARVEILDKIILKGAAAPRIAERQIGFKAGVMYCSGAVDHGVVMVKDKALVFHMLDSLFNLMKILLHDIVK